MMRTATTLTVGLALAALLTGCRIQVDKDASGKEKTVQVDTPFGGVHVNTDKTTAADLGLPVYRLPSTSPAHASWSLERKLDAWREVFLSCELLN